MAPTTTSTTVLYPTPPPTQNKMGHTQRHRLMKSTHKLEQVLGTTPFILEASDLPVTLLPVGSKRAGKASRRERSVFSHSSSSSVSSFESCETAPSPSFVPSSLPDARPSFSEARSRRSGDNGPRPLFIRLAPVPVSPSDDRVTTSLPPTPTTATPLASGKYTFPPTPSTPTFDQAEVRRKRMAKLTRHLGETIPPELVSANPRKPTKKSSSMRTRKRRSMSVGGLFASNEVKQLQRREEREPMPVVSYCPPRAGLAEDAYVQPTVERQVSWVGEWNMNDMQEIQKKLRALKGR